MRREKAHRGGRPGTFINSLGVASADNIATVLPFVTFGDYLTAPYYESLGYGNPGFKTFVSADEYEFVYIDGYGTEDDFSFVSQEVDLEGKIVICNRGEISFYVKANNAFDYGAAAIIVANNDSGYIYMNLTGYQGDIPAVSITLADAETIKDNLESSSILIDTHSDPETGDEVMVYLDYYEGTLTITGESDIFPDEEHPYAGYAQVSDFSSWGVPGSLLMKPEITAPGGNMYSVDGSSNRITDAYESMSGTSMAAPAISGLAAVLAQYVRENGIAIEGYTTRAIVQSLLMSTAHPLFDDEYGYYCYFPVLQQGAGLADLYAAVTSASVIMMSDDDDSLTALTGAARDGKVKAELGDDPDRTGEYTFSFTVYNLRDFDLEYELYTDIFTQYWDTDGEFMYMMPDTEYLNYDVTYTWLPDRDINMDGEISEADAQAILDYITGLITADDIDLARADLDGDGDVTSYDAYLMLNYTPDDEILVVPANGSKEVTVTITLDDNSKDYLDYIFPNGAYIQGYTYVYGYGYDRETGDELYDDEHSIPILAFYGDWTDPSMFDHGTVENVLGYYVYDEPYKYPYSGNDITNWLDIKYNGGSEIFTGNPYYPEEVPQYDYYALRSDALVEAINYVLLRSAGTVGIAVSSIDEMGGDVTEILGAAIQGINVDGLYFYENSGSPSWYNDDPTTVRLGYTPADFLLEEGDMFRLGVYAIPEYTAMRLYSDLGYSMTDPYSGYLNLDYFTDLIASNTLGKGAFFGYDFTVDDTTPVIETAEYDAEGEKITIKVTDNQHIAYVAVMDLDGNYEYFEVAPGDNEYEYVIEGDVLDEILEYANSYVAVFAADYAGNETAVALKVNDHGETSGQIYRLTDEIKNGGKYIILNGDDPDEELIALARDDNDIFASQHWTVHEGTPSSNFLPYIDAEYVEDYMIWTNISINPDKAMFTNDGYYLTTAVSPRRIDNGANDEAPLLDLAASSTTASAWDIAENGYYAFSLSIMPDGENLYDIAYDYDSWYLGTEDQLDYYLDYDYNTTIYIYELVDAPTDIDPFTPFEIDLEEYEYFLYLGGTANIGAYVYPLTATEKELVYESDDEEVATVDENGVITAVGTGYAEIKVTSATNENAYEYCDVYVIALDKTYNAIVWDEVGDVYFSEFQTEDLRNWTRLHDESLDLRFVDTMIVEGELYALTNESALYHVDPETFELDKVSDLYYQTNSIAPGASLGSAPTYAQSYYSYLLFNYVENMNTDEEPIFVIDLGEDIAAITLGYDYGDEVVYFIVTVSGDLLEVSFWEEDEGEWDWNYYYYGNIGIESEYDYQDLYYNGEYLLFSCCDETVSELYVIDIDYITGDIYGVYDAGDFGDGVWPVCGIYDPEAFAEPETPGRLSIPVREARTLNSGLSSKVRNGRLASVDSIAPADTTVTNTVIEIAPVRALELYNFATSGVTDVDAQTATFTLTEEVDVTNGLVTFEYDTEKLTFKEVTTDATISSFVDDAEEGKLVIAFADTQGFEAETVILTVVFDSLDCLETELTVTTEEINDDFTGYEEEVTITGTTHDWAEPEFGWITDDDGNYTGALVEFVCNNDEEHVRYIRAAFDSETTPPTCTEDGQIVYTATVTGPDGVEYTDTKTVVLNATGHSYGDVTYTWSEDNSTCTASRTCATCQTVDDETVNSTSATENPTCTESGKTTYTAEFENEAFETQVKEVVLDAAGHVYGEVVYTWSEDKSTCTATVVCEQNDNTVTETVNSTSVTQNPTCTESGKTTYTATFQNELFETQTAEVIHNATGHRYGNPEYTWAEDHSTCTATAYCLDCSNSVVEEVNSTSATENPTCTESGKTTYTATFQNELFETQTAEVGIDAAGHSYGTPEYTWAEDHSTCTATVYCDNCSNSVTETVEADADVTPATCEGTGHASYTATFQNELFETQTFEEDLDPIGHRYTLRGFEWAEDFSSAVAVFVCENDGSHVERYEAEITTRTTDDHMIIYTATVQSPNGDFVFEDSPAVPQTGDNFAVVMYTVIAVATIGAAVIGTTGLRKKFNEQ